MDTVHRGSKYNRLRALVSKDIILLLFHKKYKSYHRLWMYIRCAISVKYFDKAYTKRDIVLLIKENGMIIGTPLPWDVAIDKFMSGELEQYLHQLIKRIHSYIHSDNISNKISKNAIKLFNAVAEGTFKATEEIPSLKVEIREYGKNVLLNICIEYIVIVIILFERNICEYLLNKNEIHAIMNELYMETVNKTYHYLEKIDKIDEKCKMMDKIIGIYNGRSLFYDQFDKPLNLRGDKTLNDNVIWQGVGLMCTMLGYEDDNDIKMKTILVVEVVDNIRELGLYSL